VWQICASKSVINRLTCDEQPHWIASRPRAESRLPDSNLRRDSPGAAAAPPGERKTMRGPHQSMCLSAFDRRPLSSLRVPCVLRVVSPRRLLPLTAASLPGAGRCARGAARGAHRHAPHTSTPAQAGAGGGGTAACVCVCVGDAFAVLPRRPLVSLLPCPLCAFLLSASKHKRLLTQQQHE
jgi:hypothetical protein